MTFIETCATVRLRSIMILAWVGDEYPICKMSDVVECWELL